MFLFVFAAHCILSLTCIDTNTRTCTYSHVHTTHIHGKHLQPFLVLSSSILHFLFRFLRGRADFVDGPNIVKRRAFAATQNVSKRLDAFYTTICMLVFIYVCIITRLGPCICMFVCMYGTQQKTLSPRDKKSKSKTI